MGWTVRGSNPAAARFSARQTGPVAYPASFTMDTGSFPGVKSGRGVLLTTHPLLAPWSWKSRAIPLPTLLATTGPVRRSLYIYHIFHLQRCLHFYVYFILTFVVDEFITLCNICTVYTPLRWPQQMAETFRSHLYN